jgi:hypothetical protein
MGGTQSTPSHTQDANNQNTQDANNHQSKKRHISLENDYLKGSSKKSRIQILENQMVTLNGLLLFAKFSVFPDMPSRIKFANSVTDAIISYGIRMGVSCINYAMSNEESYTFACRFLQITVTKNDVTKKDDFFLSKLKYKDIASTGDWVCDLFNESSQQNNEILIDMLAIIQRQRQLINKPGTTMTFCIDYYHNRRSRTNSTIFHQDIDFSDTFHSTPSYTCTMTTSNPEKGYGVSTEIMAKGGDKTFKFASLPCDALLINNNELLHATPSQTEITPGNISTSKDAIIRMLDSTDNKTVTPISGLQITPAGTFSNQVKPIIEEINANNKLSERNIIRILTYEGGRVDISNPLDVTSLVPPEHYVSKIVNYTVEIEGRDRRKHVQEALELPGEQAAIGGTTKKRKRDKTRNKKRRKRYTKKRTQRGGTTSDFAIYATNKKTAQLIMNNIEITEL